jgi:hypothetical protein
MISWSGKTTNNRAWSRAPENHCDHACDPWSPRLGNCPPYEISGILAIWRIADQENFALCLDAVSVIDNLLSGRHNLLRSS